MKKDKNNNMDWEKQLKDKFFTERNGWIVPFASTDSFELLIKFIHSLLKSQSQKKEILESIDPFDLVEDCNPDCTPEQHAYHKGTWDAHLKLEKILSAMKKEEENDR
ncbi:MAG: hypothetical protein AABY22_00395 [Nanoarchaeota archaeon]